MTPHQSFTDLATISLALMAGKISTVFAQTPTSTDWAERLTGPFSALFVMGVGIWWLSTRNAKQDIKLEEKQKLQDAKDAENLESRIEAMKIMTEALESTKNVVAQNNILLEKTSRALAKHKCINE